ncbi:hypothetical protein BOX15_Mlig029992g2, partial [Macrostomum lignano]
LSMSYGSIGGSSGSAGFSQQEDDRKLAQLIDRCTYNVQKLDNNVKDLERLCAQLNAGRPSNVVSITSAISDKQSGTNALISASADLLQQLSSLRTDNSMLNTRRTRLLEQYKASVAKYKRVQETAMRRVHDLVQLQQEQQQQQQDEAADQMSGLARQDQLQANAELLNMQNQEQRMREMLGDIQNIEEMFKELSSMVYDQGIMCDDIAQNVASAADNAEEGRDQLRQAVVYKRKARKKCIILIIVGIVVAGILALIIYLSVRGH